MKEKKYLIYGITIVLLTIIGVTLAYFITEIEGNKKDVTINTGDLRVIFNNGEKIEGIDIEPGWSVTKTFSIENKSKTEYKYNIVIQDLVNTFVSDNLVYKITSTNNGHNMTDYEVLPKSETAEDTILTYSTTISGKTTQEYTIEVKFKEEDRNQYEDMGKTITGKIYITEGTEKPIPLLNKILADNPTRRIRSNDNNGTNDFATLLTETTTGTLFTSTESIEGSTPVNVYYYSGNTTNNWVKFGQYTSNGPIIGYYSSSYLSSRKEYSTMDECTSASSYNVNCGYAWNFGDNMYWRIIRTNHDKSIRLLYAGTSHDTTSGHIGESAFNTNYKSPKYVGYKYGEDDSTLDGIRANTTDSTIKTYIDTWYQNNLTNYTKYLSTSAVYCNDRSEGTGETYNYASSPSSLFNFAPYYRMDYVTKGANANPTYNCSDIRDAFSVDNINAQLSYPIALMTADEIAFAGGVAYTQMRKPYAWFISNSAGTQVSNRWWSLSPFNWYNRYANEWNWPSDSDGLGYYNVYRIKGYVVRPVISLSPCVKVTGSGTPDDPYVVNEKASTC